MGYTSNSADPDVTLIEANEDEIVEENLDDEEIKHNVYSDIYGWFRNIFYVLQPLLRGGQ